MRRTRGAAAREAEAEKPQQTMKNRQQVPQIQNQKQVPQIQNQKQDPQRKNQVLIKL
jgi:hypothetical protein